VPDIRDLADCPQHVPVVSRWMWETWDRRRGWTLEQSIEESRSWCQRNALPWGIVAIEGNDAIGCMCLIQSDLSSHPELGPWLACQFAVPEFRGRNVASAMAEALEERAQRLGYKKLYMWTEHEPAVYRRLGWTELFKDKEFGLDVTVMCKEYS
jgi:RimJ/RimL family protein N-acetyltransferase